MSKHSGPLVTSPTAPAPAVQPTAMTVEATTPAVTPLSKHSGPLTRSPASKPAT